MVVRNKDMMEYIEEGYERKEWHIHQIPVEDVAISQKFHAFNKKKLIGARLHGAFLDGAIIPPRRITPHENLYKKHRQWIELQNSIMKNSKRAWAQCRRDNNIKEFQRIMIPFERRASYLSNKEIVMRILRNPRKYLSKLVKI